MQTAAESMVVNDREVNELWALHWAGLRDTVAYWPASDAADAGNGFKPAFSASQGTHACSVLDRQGFAESGGFIDLDPNATYRTLVLKRTAPRPKGGDRYLWGAQWLEVVGTVPPGTNGPVLYVTTRDIAPVTP